MSSDTAFPLFYEVELSKMDGQAESYKILFDKYEEDFSKHPDKRIQIFSKFAILESAAETRNCAHFDTALDQRRCIQDYKELEKLKAVESGLKKAMEKLGLPITMVGEVMGWRRLWPGELVKIVRFMSEMRSDTVFPFFYEVELSKIDEQTESYTILFDEAKLDMHEDSLKTGMKLRRGEDFYSDFIHLFLCGPWGRIPLGVGATGPSTPTLIEDGYEWTKIGQKAYLNAKYPENYFMCTHWFDRGCQATKLERRIQEGPPSYVTTYCRYHTCKE